MSPFIQQHAEAGKRLNTEFKKLSILQPTKDALHEMVLVEETVRLNHPKGVQLTQALRIHAPQIPVLAWVSLMRMDVDRFMVCVCLEHRGVTPTRTSWLMSPRPVFVKANQIDAYFRYGVATIFDAVRSVRDARDVQSYDRWKAYTKQIFERNKWRE